MEFNNSIKPGSPVELCECFCKLNLHAQFKIKLGIMNAYTLFGAFSAEFHTAPVNHSLYTNECLPLACLFAPPSWKLAVPTLALCFPNATGSCQSVPDAATAWVICSDEQLCPGRPAGITAAHLSSVVCCHQLSPHNFYSFLGRFNLAPVVFQHRIPKLHRTYNEKQ